MNEVIFKISDISEKNSPIRDIRQTVFIEEQHVPEELEWDELDLVSTHVLAFLDDIAVATARLLENGHIGRMAVLKAYRNRNIGKKMLNFMLTLAQARGLKHIEVSAQEHAIGFYEKQGFTIISDSYLDANIPHYDMKYRL
ncbi:MAG: GNAT family N-acetyltransferase [Woeseiaceae bacterium]